MEFGVDGSVLALNPEGSALGMFEKEDISTGFKCSYNGQYVCPPGLCPIEELSYITKCMTRKGGYNNTLKNMVIHASLLKGQFYDHFLWALQ